MHGDTFAHEALLYAGDESFLEGTVPFISEGVAAGEAVLVAVDVRKIDRLRAELDGQAEHVLFADMAEIGKNPAWIIPVWRDFADAHEGRPIRGIGEPIYPERPPAELVECQRHESLLNLAFSDRPAFRLLCPYDTDALPDEVIDEALRSHPIVVDRGAMTDSDRYRGLDAIAAPFDLPLAAPPASALKLAFDLDSLASVRGFVLSRANEAGLGRRRTNDLVLAVNEIATNSVLHGGGQGVARVWSEDGVLICEVEDGGYIDQPLLGRERPTPEKPGGRGLWIANRLCDLVQLRTFEHGSTVRLHMRRV
jgi:anti-sigma regulatory factor (Ser/Thr protein kinase)